MNEDKSYPMIMYPPDLYGESVYVPKNPCMESQGPLNRILPLIEGRTLDPAGSL